MPFDVMCYDSKKVFPLNDCNACIEDLGNGTYRIVAYCPCGCGDRISTNLPSRKKFIEAEKYKKDLAIQIAYDEAKKKEEVKT